MADSCRSRVRTIVVYERLRVERERHGITQEYMANLLGYQTKSAYCLKEKGIRRFYVEDALIIAKELKTSVEDLFVLNVVSVTEHKGMSETGR